MRSYYVKLSYPSVSRNWQRAERRADKKRERQAARRIIQENDGDREASFDKEENICAHTE